MLFNFFIIYIVSRVFVYNSRVSVISLISSVISQFIDIRSIEVVKTDL